MRRAAYPTYCPCIFLIAHQVQLREELASTAAHLSQVQLEALSHQQKVLELQTKLTTSLLDCKSHTKHISDLESQLEG